MTAATLAHLPLEFGGSLLNSVGRLALSLAARYMKAPLANTGIAALVAMSALAASNAMYFQPHAHPAPMFGGMAGTDPGTTSSVEPVVPETRPADLKYTPPKVQVAEKPAVKVTPQADLGPVGNSEVFEVQRKLEMMRLFTGTIDGYYGPQTARAIKKFQEMQGLKPTGELTRDVVERIRSAPMTMGDTGKQTAPVVPATPAAATATAATPMEVAPAEDEGDVVSPDRPVEPPQQLMVLPDLPSETPGSQATMAPQTQVTVAPQTQASIQPQTQAALAPLPTPEPLSAEIQTGSIQKPAQAAAVADGGPKVLGRPIPTSAEGALKMAADTAGEAIDTIVSGVQSITATKTEPPAYVEPAKIVQAKADAKPMATMQAAAAQPAVDTTVTSTTDPMVVAKVQRGLASLGFLHGPADGVAGEATAKAIRNFEVYFNYDVTGRITPGLLGLLVQNGASI